MINIVTWELYNLDIDTTVWLPKSATIFMLRDGEQWDAKYRHDVYSSLAMPSHKELGIHLSVGTISGLPHYYQ